MRDYNCESEDNLRKYAYDFDFEVMHEYMIKSFTPFLKEGSALELGSFRGDFTRRLELLFENITCVEASDKAIEIALKKLSKAQIIHSTFEECSLRIKFDNIFLTHVLEHIDDRVGLLKRIQNEWLTENGVLFIACPNANAASRQIAVSMGIISKATDVTEAEKEHGHRITYNFESLEKEIRESGLEIIHKSGIFFKALANFQWDKVIENKIVDKKYLNACYELGKKYPDLCSSIYFVCKKGK